MNAYDLVEYPAKAFPQCHPDRLAVMGRIFGLSPASPAVSRVLDIGCGDGINLIAAALVLPDAQFTGIDLSASAIQRGQQMIGELGLGNVHLEQRDLRWLKQLSTRGKFDFIVAHGLYSWITAEEREALLAGIRNVLAENGIAFVSYNAYPGAYLRQMVREMVRRLAPEGSIAEWRGWLEKLPTEASGPVSYRAVLAEECADMLRRDDAALFHDDFAEINQPFYFDEFLKAAASHGLQYVADADPGQVFAGPDADFRLGRRFHQTLLCHAGQPVAREPLGTALKDCFVGGPVSPGLISTDGTFEYVSALGGRWKTSNVEERMILESAASEWPLFLAASDLGESVFDRMLALFVANMIDLRTVAPPVAERVETRPEASSLARLQARRGVSLISLHHFEVKIESGSLRELLALADGTRTRAALIRDLGKVYPSNSKENVAIAVDTHLEDLRHYGLLAALSHGAARNSSRSKLNVTRKASFGRARKGR